MANEINDLNTRGGLATAIGLKLQDTSTNRATIIKTDLDEGYREALQRYPWPQAIRWLDSSVTPSSGASYFFLPKDVRRIMRIMNSTTPMTIDQVAMEAFIDMTCGFVTISGLPCQYARAGDSAINTTLTANTALEILGESGETRAGVIEGLLSGQQKRTTFTLSGVTPQAVGNWDEVTALYMASMSGTAGRTVTLRKVTGSTTVATIGPYETKAVYQRFRLWPQPSADTTLRIVYQYSPPAVMADTDEYIIPIQNYLHDYAWGRGLQQRREYAPAQDLLLSAETKLTRAWLDSKGDRVDQYVPASPYWATQGGFYVGAFAI